MHVLPSFLCRSLFRISFWSFLLRITFDARVYDGWNGQCHLLQVPTLRFCMSPCAVPASAASRSFQPPQDASYEEGTGYMCIPTCVRRLCRSCLGDQGSRGVCWSTSRRTARPDVSSSLLISHATLSSPRSHLTLLLASSHILTVYNSYLAICTTFSFQSLLAIAESPLPQLDLPPRLCLFSQLNTRRPARIPSRSLSIRV